VPGGRPREWRRGWRPCRLCGGAREVDAAVAAEAVRTRARREADRRAEAEAHYLPRAADDELRWLVDELGYVAEEDGRSAGPVKRWVFRSERTTIELAVALQRDPEFHVDVAPAGGFVCSLNDCLTAHGLPRVDLSLPYGPAPGIVIARLELASAALRALTPWEVGGNWSLV
jgi:hypothetical protein